MANSGARRVAGKVLELQERDQRFTAEVVINAEAANVKRGRRLNWVRIWTVWRCESTSRGFTDVHLGLFCRRPVSSFREGDAKATPPLLLQKGRVEKKQLLGRKCQNGALNSWRGPSRRCGPRSRDSRHLERRHGAKVGRGNGEGGREEREVWRSRQGRRLTGEQSRELRTEGTAGRRRKQ